MFGKIRRVNREKGFGFLSSENGDVFFHRSSIQPPYSFEELLEGQDAEFEVHDTPKGKRAERVKILNG